MKTLTKVLFIFLFFLIFCCSDVLIHYSYADIPKTLNFQAKLTDKDGVPLSGSYQIKLALYDSQTTGTKLWEETQTAAATEGVANLILGSVTALNLSFDKPYYLEISINNEKLPERQPLSSSAYALNSERLGGVASASFLYKDAKGNVGIGTTAPSEELTIQTKDVNNAGIAL